MKNDIDLYVKQFPAATQKQLNKLRAIIKMTEPAAEEIISYKMPAYKLKGFKCSKAAVQFPIDKPLPESLIKEIVAFRIKENASKK
jgi:uncharacterized protein YdhG (YjbR/CyaY superfamily)